MSEELRRAFEERAIRKVKVGGFDVDGLLRGKYISLEKFWSAVEKGFGFCDVIFGWDVADQLYDNADRHRVGARATPTRSREDRHIHVSRTSRCARHGELPRRFLHARRCEPHPACPRNLLKSGSAAGNADAGYTTEISQRGVRVLDLPRNAALTARERASAGSTRSARGCLAILGSGRGQQLQALGR